MTTDEVIEFGCALDTPTWRSLVARMMWYHEGRRHIPKELVRAEELIVDPETWGQIKRVISRSRRSKYRASKRREQLHRRERRRTYMREYMRNYRSK